MKQLLFLCFVSIAGILTACSNSSSSVETPANTLIGKWLWKETSGGIGGWTYTPATEGYKATLLIQSNTNCAIYKNDTILQAGNCTFTTTDSITYIFDLTTNFTDSIITQRLPHVVLTSDTNSFNIALRRFEDTLVVWDHNVADGFTSIFVRE